MPCAGCGTELPKQAKGRPRKWCAQCRPGAAKAAAPARKPKPAATSLVDSVRRLLTDLAAESSPRGLAALDLASRITQTDNDAAAAALHKQLLATLEEVETRAMPVGYDPVEAARSDLHVVS